MVSGLEQQTPYFLEILPHLEILLPLKCRRIFQPIHPNKHCPASANKWPDYLGVLFPGVMGVTYRYI